MSWSNLFACKDDTRLWEEQGDKRDSPLRRIVLLGSIILLSIVLLFMILLSIILLGHLLLWRILGIVAGVLHATIAHRYIVPATNSAVLICTLGLMLMVTEVPLEPSHLKSCNFLSTQSNKHRPQSTWMWPCLCRTILPVRAWSDSIASHQDLASIAHYKQIEDTYEIFKSALIITTVITLILSPHDCAANSRGASCRQAVVQGCQHSTPCWTKKEDTQNRCRHTSVKRCTTGFACTPAAARCCACWHDAQASSSSNTWPLRTRSARIRWLTLWCRWPACTQPGSQSRRRPSASGTSGKGPAMSCPSCYLVTLIIIKKLWLSNLK